MPNRSASEIAAELESRAKSYDIIGNCDDKEFPASVEYHLSAGGDAARHTARLMREAASLLRAGPAGEKINHLRALVALVEDLRAEHRQCLIRQDTDNRCLRCQRIDALLSAPVRQPGRDHGPDGDATTPGFFTSPDSRFEEEHGSRVRFLRKDE